MTNDQRQIWLEARRKGIGASDSAALCGYTDYGYPLTVYLDKLGMLPPQKENKSMRAGRMLEDAVAAFYEEDTGRSLEAPGMVWHPTIPWLFSTLDRRTPDRERVVELKTASVQEASEWGTPGTDSIPAKYVVQVQHQMAVTGAAVADVAVLIAGNDFRVYTVERSEVLIDHLLEILSDFWKQHVQQQEPPPIDWTHPRTADALNALYKPDPAKTVELGDGGHSIVCLFHALGRKISELEAERARVKAELIQAMGDAGVGLLPEGAEYEQVTRKEVPVREHVRSAHVETRLYFKKAKVVTA